MRRVAVNRRLRNWLTRASVLAFFSLCASPAHSAPKDAAATKLAEDAINVDYLATNFAEAEKKLRKGLALCGTTNCTAQVRARLHRDLGVVLVAGSNRVDDGRAEFVEALKADPAIQLDKDLTTPEIDQQFRAAQGGGAAPAGVPPPPAPAPGAAPVPAPFGDMIHTPVPEQAVLTPVPIYVELPPGVQATKVIARYRPFGSPEWKTLELRKLGNGFGGEIPCLDIGSETGDLSYYVQAFGTAGDVVSSTGSRAAPNKVAIRNQLAGDPPRLPNRPPPAQCMDIANCPPGLPGCPSGKKSQGKGWGASCDHDSECGAGLACRGGSCETGEKAAGEEGEAPSRSCDTNADCSSDEKCNSDKLCEPLSGKGKKIWLSLNVQQDFSVLGSTTDVCGNEINLPTGQILCLAEDGFHYEGAPQSGNGNAIAGGVHPASTRFLAGLDLFVIPNVTIGARLGYALNLAPDRPSLSALHAEARIAYWTGKDPSRRTGLRPYFAAMGGLAEVDDKFKTQISETLPTDPNRGIKQPGQTLTVWRKTGGAFVGGALGFMIPFSVTQGLLIEFKLQVMLPNSGFAISPSVGYIFGL
jgi:hypothetical protein